MRNRITMILLLVFVLLLVYTSVIGIKIGNFQILSISQIIEKNKTLNEKITIASNLSSVDFPENVKTLEDTYTKHKIQKQKYEELVGFAEDDDNKIYETKQYDIDYLWRTFGKYATTRNLKIGMDVKKSTSVKETLYDLNFSVSGGYANISQFISDIENNSDLNFRIYNFKMNGNGEEVLANFTIKNVNIKEMLSTQTSTETDSDLSNTTTTSVVDNANNNSTNSKTSNSVQNTSSSILQ